MENLTHTLTALMLSRAGLNRWCPRATPIILIAANIPDLDIVTRIAGPFEYLDQHRAISHSLLMAPVLATVAAAIVRFVGGKPLLWIPAILTGLVGVVSHLLLDWTNTYGIRMLLPFSGEWLRLDINFIVDIWIWAALALALAGPALSGLVGSEIGSKAKSTGRGSAIAFLVFLMAYEGTKIVLHERAVNTINSHLYLGAAPRRVSALPHFANPLSWTAVVETSSAAIVQQFNLLLPYDPAGGRAYYYPVQSKAIDAARAMESFRRFLDFSQAPLWQVTPADKPDGAVRVSVIDLRFGEPGEAHFFVSAVVDANGQIVSEERSLGSLQKR